MALWKDNAGNKANPSPFATPSPEPAAPTRFDPPPAVDARPDIVAAQVAPVRAAPREQAKGESLIAPDITIEGRIEGAGHVRIAGRFKGDVDVRGDLTIETGASVNGSVRAERVVIAGELNGNIESASHVELLQSGSLTGDVKAGSLTVAAGSRMRGQADFGWDDSKSATIVKAHSNGKAAEHGLGT